MGVADEYDLTTSFVGRHDGLAIYVFDGESSGPEWFGHEWQYQFDVDDASYQIVVGRHADGSLVSNVTGPGVPVDNQISERATFANEGSVGVSIETELLPQLGREFDWTVALFVDGIEVDVCSTAPAS